MNDDTLHEMMADEAALAAIGIRVSGNDLGELKAAATRIARHITTRGLRSVGFIPSDDRIAVPPVAIHLGLALVELTGATVAVVDANVRYPGLTELSRVSPAQVDDDAVFATRWIRGSLAVLTPAKVERAGEVVPQLGRMIEQGSELFQHMLIDLTGFELLGEHANAASVMDGIVLMGRAHRTRDSELMALSRLMPVERFLGVLLVG